MLLLIVLPVYASHIVGGEFELLHISGNTYRLNLIYYFDVNHGFKDALGNPLLDPFGNPLLPENVDSNIIATIYQKSNNRLMTSLVLPFTSKEHVSYTQPACSHGEVVTDKLIYSIDFEMPISIYNDPQGYYVSWQRCCRNYTITNIYSDPPAQGIYAGQTFYLEFPPVIKNGQPFINSSPHLFPPLNDYACPGRPYYVNFAGVDDDNDSIAYSLTTPLTTFTSEGIPTHPSPGPYPLVQWRPSYSLLNIMGGSPDLRISRDGLLTCTPGEQGLFVFAVKAEEFRNGVKIGETRRDFQLFVVPGCQPDQPPQITGKKLTDASFSYVNNMAVSFDGTVSDGNRCINIQVSDPDSQDPLQNFSENISIRVVALNFKTKTLNSILPSVTTGTLSHGSTQEFRICFPQCPFINGPFQIGIIAFDDACSLPMTDTLKVTVNQQPPPNSNAYFLPQKITTAQLNEGSTGSWPFAAKDDDGDDLILAVVTDGFTLSSAGMTYNILSQQAGSANGTIGWNAFCKFYEFSKQTDFVVKVLVDDKDLCNFVQWDTAVFNLKVILPDIEPKLKIYNEAHTLDVTNTTFEANLGHIVFDVIGTDVNVSAIDTLNLSLLGATGNIMPSGYSFANSTGVHTVESKFAWDPNCSIFKDGSYDNQYQFQFVVANNHCKTPKADTAYVKLRIKDVDSNDKNFLPANVITTFPDHCNDFFAIDGFESEPNCEGQVRQVASAPADNCVNQFEHVRIYDRWGKLVFESADRKFRWYASSESASVYYYLIKYTLKEYKGSLTVIH